MAAYPRLPRSLRGVPARLGAVVLVAASFGGWAVWPSMREPAAPPSLALAGKHADRLAFSGDESEIPVREARIYDTIAMFAQPQAEARPWSQPPVAATMQEAGIKPAPMRPVTLPKLAASEVGRKVAETPPTRPQRVAAEPARSAAKVGPEAVRVFGWNVPGSEHLPTRRDASRVIETIGSGATAVGSGTVRVVSRTATALGDGVASAGNALADTLGLN